MSNNNNNNNQNSYRGRGGGYNKGRSSYQNNSNSSRPVSAASNSSQANNNQFNNENGGYYQQSQSNRGNGAYRGGRGGGTCRGDYYQNSRPISGANNFAEPEYQNRNNNARRGGYHGERSEGGGFNKPDHSNNQTQLKEMCKNEIEKKLNKYDYVNLSTVRNSNPHALIFKKRNGAITIGEKAKFIVNHFDFEFPNYEFNLFRVDIIKNEN